MADKGASGGTPPTDPGTFFDKSLPVSFWLGAKSFDQRNEPRLTEMKRTHPSFGGPDSGNQKGEAER